MQRVSICGLAKCALEPLPEGIGADLRGVLESSPGDIASISADERWETRFQLTCHAISGEVAAA